MLYRNHELAVFARSFCAVSMLGIAVAFVIFGVWVALLCTGMAAGLAAVAAWHTRKRYRALARMAAQIDQELHEPRSMKLDCMSEGELAILANELDKLVNRLNLTAEQLEHERSALADSLADISHQIKTPITSLSIMTEVVRKRLADADKPLEPAEARDLSERLRCVEALQERVQSLVSALLKLARLDAGTVRLVSAPVRTARLVEEAFKPLAVAFDIADVAFEEAIDPAATFMGDSAWSAEALENILKNCLEHTPAGGAVRVETHEDTLACRIRITDTGPGIAEADLPHIFERFYRGERPCGESAVNPSGVGIGLALAQSLIVAQGGKITATNRYGKTGRIDGAQFDITFFKATV